ncbi:hypothetical protein DRH14_02320 [Candidatus Shapirobacteria bacterium]|nr:MAG: hypothetical protein DRH14_02320 [Candidatus Shapirobacteria bacterium]
MRVGDISNVNKKTVSITLKQAIEMGEYDENFLSQFDEWNRLTRNMKWQLIRKALENKKRALRLNYAEIFNMLDFSKKPHLAEALKNVEKAIEDLYKDKEKLFVEYSK